jgi:carbon-monoxide dehydrogenase medium subunit
VVARARIGIAGVAERGLRATSMEAALAGAAPTPVAIDVAADAAVEPIDFTGTAAISPAYRRDLTRALLVRAVSRAAGLAGGQVQ